jgi:hypothetical protein
MDDASISSAVDAAYKKKYQEVKATKVRHIVRDLLPGALVVVACTKQDASGLGSDWEEICYAKGDQILIFDDTESLVRGMLEESRNFESIQELQDRRSVLQRHFARLQQVRLGSLVGALGCLAFACFLGFYYPIRIIPGVIGVYGLGMLVLASAANGNLRQLAINVEELDYKIDLQRYRVSATEARAEKILRLNDFQLRRYYESTLRQNAFVFWLGLFCILLGVGISGYALWLVAAPTAVAAAAKAGLADKIVTAALGAVGALLTNYVAAIYLKMHAEAAKNLVTLHSRLVDTHRSLFGNLVASRISDEKLRWETLAKIAITVSKSTESATTTDVGKV